MLTKTLKRVKLKGKATPIVREQYLRDDISCHSPVCKSCNLLNEGPKSVKLQKDVSHYAIPCFDIIEKYLEILELPELKGLIILQSITSKVMQAIGHRACNRLQNITNDIRRGNAVFLDEMCIKTHVPRFFSDSYEEWLMKCCVKSAEYYSDHLHGEISIILISENNEKYLPLIKNDNVKVCTLGEYLKCMYKDLEPAIQLYESLKLAISAGSVKDLSSSYDHYLTTTVLEAGIKSGRYHKGYLRVNKHKASQEAFVASSKTFIKDAGDIFICGMKDRNRAIHGDEVVVEILPSSQWKCRSLNLEDNSNDPKENTGENADNLNLEKLTTGRIVGILERRWRNYVATLPEEDDESNTSSRNKERILVIPYDYRIPKIRILTKQAENIRNQRILVRIDHWERDSQYPNGHLVQTLGELGAIETDIKSLLIEHEIFVGEFPQNLTPENLKPIFTAFFTFGTNFLVRIDHWERDSQYPNGHLVQTLGELGAIEADIKSLLIEHEIFLGEFPQNLVNELPICTEENPWTLESIEIQKRKDLRNSHLIFSIDPKGCEDVDDALSVRKLPNGFLELGVHIADVTHFVRPLSLVDLEARSRATSVYLPDRRYDMLPHVLSGNLCSLLGNVDRYAVSVLWELDNNCKVQNVWYGRTIINSRYKLCYEAAQDILFGATAEKMKEDIPELQGLVDEALNMKFQELKNSLSKLYYIADTIRKERLYVGGLELNSINMKFEIDRNLPSVVTDVKSAKELAVHKTVAECMIFANHWVAKKISEAFPQQAVLRRHPSPREADLAELQKLASTKGFTLNIHSNKELALSLEQTVDSSDPSINQIFRILATQTMNQATYCCTGSFSEEDLYHYGLGLEKYTHFTSPIRRYADILVHRLLLLAVEEQSDNLKLGTVEMEDICNHMNIKHRAAQDIEKDAQQLFLALFFEDLAVKENCTHILVDAIIYSIRSNGVLIFIPKYGIKGALHLCNKDKKVAIIRENLEWTDGKLSLDASCITVEALGVSQKYHIFDHLTVCIKVQKSRSHQQKILFDLMKNEPYLSDWDKVVPQEPELLSLQGEMKTEVTGSKIEDQTPKKDFNLYLFLEKMRNMTLIAVDEGD